MRKTNIYTKEDLRKAFEEDRNLEQINLIHLIPNFSSDMLEDNSLEFFDEFLEKLDQSKKSTTKKKILLQRRLKQLMIMKQYGRK